MCQRCICWTNGEPFCTNHQALLALPVVHAAQRVQRAQFGAVPAAQSFAKRQTMRPEKQRTAQVSGVCTDTHPCTHLGVHGLEIIENQLADNGCAWHG